MPKCGACGKFLPTTGVAPCSKCPLIYHKACLTMTDKDQISKDWVCPTCKLGIRKGDNSQTPVKGICETLTLSRSPTSGKVMESSTSDSCQGVMTDAIPSSDGAVILEFRKMFAECMAEMREFRTELMLMRETFTAANARLDTMEQRLDGMEKRLQGLESRESTGGSERVEGLERTVAALRLEINERDQDALLADIDIGQVPEVKGESAAHTVLTLAARLGVALEARDVVFAERVGAPPRDGERARRIVVRLARRDLRDELLRAARVRRDFKSSDGRRIFLNERLTRQNRLLFNKARMECRSRNWRYCWTRQGRIFARQGEGKPAFRLCTEDDIVRVLGSSTS